MLFLSDWEPRLTLNPSVSLRRLFLFETMLALAAFGFLFLYAVEFQTLVHLIGPVFISLFWLVWLRRIWQMDISLKNSKSVIGVHFHRYPQPNWSLLLSGGGTVEELSIKRYFLSSKLMVLHFTERIVTPIPESIHGSSVKLSFIKQAITLCSVSLGTKSYSCMILPDQVGEQAFRNLYLSLSLAKEDLLS